MPLRADMTDADDIIATVGRAEKRWHGHDRRQQRWRSRRPTAHKMSIQPIDQVLDTNLRGPYILSCEVARR